jgi:6,7-dimethyl-8-ribityllumazine synthase
MTMRKYEGSFDGRDLRIAIVGSRFNATISGRLVEGAIDCLRRHGVSEDRMLLIWVPGAFELAATASRIAASGEVDAVVCVGVVIRGETPHFDYVADSAATGLLKVGVDTGLPVSFGVLTCDTTEQAEARAGGKMGNKGFEAALAALEMANLFAALPKPSADL